jgi:hypothetical protein
MSNDTAMIDDLNMTLKGRDCGLTDVISLYFLRGIEENHENLSVYQPRFEPRNLKHESRE